MDRHRLVTVNGIEFCLLCMDSEEEDDHKRQMSVDKAIKTKQSTYEPILVSHIHAKNTRTKRQFWLHADLDGEANLVILPPYIFA